MPDNTELTHDEIIAALAQLKQISEYPTPSTQYARVLLKYITTLVESQKKAHSVMAGVVTTACIRGVRPFDGIECDPQLWKKMRKRVAMPCLLESENWNLTHQNLRN